MLLFSFSIDVDSFSVLFALVPVTNVLSSIRPFEGALTLFHVVNILTDILSAIRPGKGTMALHLVVLPVTSVDSAISPFIDT
jgi:hypothetical protein